MAGRPTHSWYVSFEMPRPLSGEKRPYLRTTRTFESEIEAKNFAKERLQESPDVNAGTLNPVLPKRVITSAQIYKWLEAPSVGESDFLDQGKQPSVPTPR
jgi:hypothetical protein